jgi:SNF2 family DNA or RNA helicase
MKVYYNKLGKRYSWDIDVRNDGKTLAFRFNYNKQIVEEIKALAGARWNPDHKYWTAPASKRNLIALEILQGDYTIYEWYDQPLMNDVKLPDDVKAFQHQVHGVKHIITKKRTLIAGEPGVGKTLLALLGLFNTECTTPLIVAPHSALAQWKRELIKWGFHRMYPWRWSTYESLQKILTEASG